MKRPPTVTKNVVGAFASRLVSMTVAALLVPLLLRLIGTERYGVWTTLISLISLVGTLDLGVGNSLRNSVAFITDPAEMAGVRREFITFFHLLCGVALLAILGLLLAAPLFPLVAQHYTAALLLYLPILLFIPLLLGSSVLQGARAIGLQTLLQSASVWLFFLATVGCYWMAWRPGLKFLALAWSGSYSILIFIIFAIGLRHLQVPFWQLFRRPSGPLPTSRLKVGVSFLILQLSTLILYSLGNAIVFHGLGAKDAARYDVLNRIFQIGLSFYTIIIGVIWSEIARYRALRDFVSLQLLYKRMIIVALLFSIGAFTMASITPWTVSHWTGHKLSVDSFEALSSACQVSVQAFAYVGAVFMNAFERIKVQVLFAVVSILFMIPLALHLITKGFGIAAVPISAAALTMLPLIFCNIIALALIRRRPNMLAHIA